MQQATYGQPLCPPPGSNSILFCSMDYTIYCDESEDKGQYFSNFYGGVLVRTSDIEECNSKLLACKASHGHTGELKWTKVNENYFDLYRDYATCFFELMAVGKVKTRIMFTQNSNVPIGLTHQDREDSFLKLYYQFLKHGFAFADSDLGGEETTLRIYADELPASHEKIARFKGFILGLNRSEIFATRQIKIDKNQIAEIESHQHPILQGLDIVLGSMNFRLNNLHRAIPPGKKRRGKRTRAKENLYKHIYAGICRFKPRFNIGVTTGGNRWSMPYRHWLFKPSDYQIDPTLHKPKK